MPTIGQHPLQRDVVLFEERDDAVVEQIGGGDRGLAVVELGERDLGIGVDEGLLIDPPRPKARSPQTNGICERFHKTVLDEFYRIACRKRIYATTEQLQVDLDAWMTEYNQDRSHQGRWCYGKTPMQTFLDTLPIAQEKSIRAA